MEEPQGSINISHTIKNLRDSILKSDKFIFKINLIKVGGVSYVMEPKMSKPKEVTFFNEA